MHSLYLHLAAKIRLWLEPDHPPIEAKCWSVKRKN